MRFATILVFFWCGVSLTLSVPTHVHLVAAAAFVSGFTGQIFAVLWYTTLQKKIPGDLPDADGLMALMAQDKKVIDGRLRFILARAIGEAFVAEDVDPEGPRQVLSDALAGR